MNHKLICSWLGLPPEHWPPDHYRLLGLEPGESDIALIEQRVHQRLDLVRRYQMTHPEQVTEAMNRLAQAFVCLTEAKAKQVYDSQLQLSKPRVVPPPLPEKPSLAGPPPSPALLPAPAEPRDPLIWLYTPGVNGPDAPPPPPIRHSAAVEEKPAPVEAAPVEPKPPASPPPAPEPVDPILEAAQRSAQARKGLSTRKSLFRRVADTRQLLRLWHRVGKYLGDPERPLQRSDASELYKLVEQIEEASEEFPLLGEAGQPGHLIVSLTQFDRSRDLLTLNYGQRESLKRDWDAGLRFLEAHRDFLRVEMAVARRRGWLERMVRTLRGWLNENPAVGLLVLLGLLALGIAVWRSAL